MMENIFQKFTAFGLSSLLIAGTAPDARAWSVDARSTAARTTQALFQGNALSLRMFAKPDPFLARSAIEPISRYVEQSETETTPFSKFSEYHAGDPILLQVGEGLTPRYVAGTVEHIQLPSENTLGSITLTQPRFQGTNFAEQDGRITLPLDAQSPVSIVVRFGDFVTVKEFVDHLPARQQKLLKEAILTPKPKFIEHVSRLTGRAASTIETLDRLLSFGSSPEADARRKRLSAIRELLWADEDARAAKSLYPDDLGYIADREEEILIQLKELKALTREDVRTRFWIFYSVNRLERTIQDLQLLKTYAGRSFDGMVRSPEPAPVVEPVSPAHEETFRQVIIGAGPNGIQSAVWQAVTGDPKGVVVISAEDPMRTWSDQNMPLVSMRTDIGRMDPGQGLPVDLAKKAGLSRNLVLIRLLTGVARAQVVQATGRSFRGVPAKGSSELTLEKTLGSSPSRAETVLSYSEILRQSGVVFIREPIVGYAAQHDDQGHPIGAVAITRSGRRLVAPSLVIASGVVGLHRGNARTDAFFENDPAYRVVRSAADLRSPTSQQEFLEATQNHQAISRQLVVASSIASDPAVEQLVKNHPDLSIGIEGAGETALKTAIHYLNSLPKNQRHRLKIHFFTRDPIEVTARPVPLYSYKTFFFGKFRKADRYTLKNNPDKVRAGQISQQSFDDFEHYRKLGLIEVHQTQQASIDDSWIRVPVQDPTRGPITRVYERLADGSQGKHVAEITNFWVPAFGYDSGDESNAAAQELAAAGLIELGHDGKPVPDYGPYGSLRLKAPNGAAPIITVVGSNELNRKTTLHELTGVPPATAHLTAQDSLGKQKFAHALRIKASGAELSADENDLMRLILSVVHDPEFGKLAGPGHNPRVVYAGALEQEKLEALGAKQKKHPGAFVHDRVHTDAGVLIDETTDKAQKFDLEQSLYQVANVEVIPDFDTYLSNPEQWAKGLKAKTSAASGPTFGPNVEALLKFLAEHKTVDVSDVAAYASPEGLILDQAKYQWLAAQQSTSPNRQQSLSGKPESLLIQVLDWANGVYAFDRGISPKQVAKQVTIDPELRERLAFSALQWLRPDSLLVPIDKAFNWNAVLPAVMPSGAQWHLVVFSSVLNPDLDGKTLDLLHAKDAAARLEAAKAPGYIFYQQGEFTRDGYAVSFCLWATPEDARIASQGPAHAEAMKLAMPSAERPKGIYKSFQLDTYEIVNRNGSITFKPTKRMSRGPRPVAPAASPVAIHTPPYREEFHYSPKNLTVGVTLDGSATSEQDRGYAHALYENLLRSGKAYDLFDQWADRFDRKTKPFGKLLEIEIRLTHDAALHLTTFFDPYEGKLVVSFDPESATPFPYDADAFHPASSRPKDVFYTDDFIRTLAPRYANVHRGSGPHSQTTTDFLEQAKVQVLFGFGLPEAEWDDYQVIFNSQRPHESVISAHLVNPLAFYERSSSDYGLPFGTSVLVVRKDNIRPDLERPSDAGGGTILRRTDDGVTFHDVRDADFHQPGTPASLLAITLARLIYLEKRGIVKRGSNLSPAAAAALTVEKSLALDAHLEGVQGQSMLEFLRTNALGNGEPVVGSDRIVHAHTFLDSPASWLVFGETLETFLRALRLAPNQYAELIRQAGDAILHFLNAAEGFEFVVVGNSSEGLSLISHALADWTEANPGQGGVITSRDAHTAADVPFLADPLFQVPLQVNDDGYIDPSELSDKLKDYNGPNSNENRRIRLVVLSGASNTEGTGVFTRDLSYVQHIADITHHYGALLVVDIAQAVAHRPIDLKNAGADIVVLSGHKMGAPFGEGALISRVGTFLHESITERKIAVHQTPVAGLASLAVLVRLFEKAGMGLIQSTEEALTAYALEKLRAILGLQLIGANNGVILFNFAETPYATTALVLAGQGVSLRSGLFCAGLHTQDLVRESGASGANRVGLALYNSREDIDRFVEALLHVTPSTTKVNIESDRHASLATALSETLSEPEGQKALKGVGLLGVHTLRIHFIGDSDAYASADGHHAFYEQPGTFLDPGREGVRHVVVEPQLGFGKLSFVERLVGLLTRTDRTASKGRFYPETEQTGSECIASNMFTKAMTGAETFHGIPQYPSFAKPLDIYRSQYPVTKSAYEGQVSELPSGLLRSGFKLLQIQRFDILTYLLFSGDGTATVIDPSLRDVGTILEILKKNDVSKVRFIETHVHAEHLSASVFLKKVYDWYVGKEAEAVIGLSTEAKGNDRYTVDGTSLDLGKGYVLTAHATPGHTPGDMSYLLTDTQSGKAPILFTGDTLIKGGPGRTDFPRGSAKESFNSLQWIFTLPDDVLVLAAHSLSLDPHFLSTTVGAERTRDGVVQQKTVDAYEAALASQYKGERLPSIMDRALRFNRNPLNRTLDPYEILGVNTEASVEEINAQHQTKVAEYRSNSDDTGVELADAAAATLLFIQRHKDTSSLTVNPQLLQATLGSDMAPAEQKQTWPYFLQASLTLKEILDVLGYFTVEPSSPYEGYASWTLSSEGSQFFRSLFGETFGESLMLWTATDPMDPIYLPAGLWVKQHDLQNWFYLDLAAFTAREFSQVQLSLRHAEEIFRHFLQGHFVETYTLKSQYDRTVYERGLVLIRELFQEKESRRSEALRQAA